MNRRKIILRKSPRPDEIKDVLKTLEKQIRTEKQQRKEYPTGTNLSKDGRPRKYRSEAERQAAYRRRKKSSN